MPLDLLITGRIATLAGDAGFGWVEAIGITNGRVAFAGTEVWLETRADPFTRRIQLEPDEVALPGLTDAHLHLAECALEARQVNLGDAPTLEDALGRIGQVHGRLGDPDGWVVGQGWDADRWGRWPTADHLESAAPGRRVAIWAHDHHALWVSHGALRTAGIDETTADPTGGVIGRDSIGRPDGILYEGAGHLVDVHLPLPSGDELDDGIVQVGRELVALGIVACHDPGGIAPDPDLRFSYASYTRLADAGRLPVRVHASMRDDGVPVAAERGLRSGRPLGADPSGRATVGWQKCFADGSLGSRTAALLEDIEPEADRPLPPGQRRGVWNTDRDTLAALVDRAAGAGIATQIHAIGDAAARAALDVLAPGAATSPLMPRLEHVQLLDPADRSRFAESGIAASVQPIHLASDAAKARRLWGARAESNGYPLASLAATGAVLGFGTDAPVESFDPWPGIAMAVCRADPGWPAGTAPYGPQEALTLDRALRAACVDPAVMAREPDRGRLTVGQRADVVVLPAAAIDEPVTPGGPLGTVRPSLVLLDGEIAFEAQL